MIDIGANLADTSFHHDLDDVLHRARRAGLAAIVVTGSSADSNARAQVLATQHPDLLHATAGLHPHHAADWSTALDAQIRDLAQQQCIVAAGEMGLDYFRDLSPRPAQRAAFEAQLDIACDFGLPAFLHQREAHSDFLAILRERRDALPACVVHCFTDTRAALGDYLALDCHIGITGWICDERRRGELPEAVADIPADRLMVETDAPYLMPRTIRPRPKTRRNEPANLPWVIAAVAEARGETPAAVETRTAAVARQFFGLDGG